MGPGFGDGQRHLLAKAVGDGARNSFSIWVLGGALYASVGDATNNTTLFASKRPSIGDWHHVALTHDATTTQLYLDGELVVTNDTPTALGYDEHVLLIGADSNFRRVEGHWLGALRDVRLWNGVRSADDIRAAMSGALTGNEEAGLSGWWPLDDEDTTRSADRSGGGHDGDRAANGPVAWVRQPLRIDLQGGTLSGAGTIAGTLRNAARVVVGGDGNTGVLAVNGGYTQDSGAVLQVELAGATPGTQFDRLAIAGAATLDGTLEVAFAGGFTPTAGNTFRVLDFGSRTGSFASVDGTRGQVSAAYDATGLTLHGELAGIKVEPSAGLQTSEAGGSASFDVVLDVAPGADVTVALSSSRPDEGRPSVELLRFTPQDWNLRQTVTVTGRDDDIDDGDVAYRIVLSAAVSDDPAFDGFDPSDVLLTNVDDDVAGFVVTPQTGLVTTEAGGNAGFTVALRSQPTAEVRIAVVSNDPGEGTVAPQMLVFTPQDWGCRRPSRSAGSTTAQSTATSATPSS